MMKFICDGCGNEFERYLSDHKRWLEKGSKKKYCSAECFRKHRCSQIIEVTCEFCGNVFETRDKHRKFCSQSCSAKYNNKIGAIGRQRRKDRKVWLCVKCGEKCLPRRKYCESCNPQNRDWDKVTIGDLKKLNSNQFHVTVRDRAKSVYRKSSLPKKCVICSYEKHYHVSHIKPIAEFKDNDTLAIINSLQNLIALCPNHHWEFDHKILSSDDKKVLDNYIEKLKDGPMV